MQEAVEEGCGYLCAAAAAGKACGRPGWLREDLRPATAAVGGSPPVAGGVGVVERLLPVESLLPKQQALFLMVMMRGQQVWTAAECVFANCLFAPAAAALDEAHPARPCARHLPQAAGVSFGAQLSLWEGGGVAKQQQQQRHQGIRCLCGTARNKTPPKVEERSSWA